MQVTGLAAAKESLQTACPILSLMPPVHQSIAPRWTSGTLLRPSRLPVWDSFPVNLCPLPNRGILEAAEAPDRVHQQPRELCRGTCQADCWKGYHSGLFRQFAYPVCFSDADWSGNRQTRKSVSAAVVLWDSMTIYSHSKT